MASYALGLQAAQPALALWQRRGAPRGLPQLADLAKQIRELADLATEVRELSAVLLRKVGHCNRLARRPSVSVRARIAALLCVRVSTASQAVPPCVCDLEALGLHVPSARTAAARVAVGAWRAVFGLESKEPGRAGRACGVSVIY